MKQLRRHVEAYHDRVSRRILARMLLVLAGFALAAALYFVLNPS